MALDLPEQSGPAGKVGKADMPGSGGELRPTDVGFIRIRLGITDLCSASSVATCRKPVGMVRAVHGGSGASAGATCHRSAVTSHVALDGFDTTEARLAAPDLVDPHGARLAGYRQGAPRRRGR